MNARIAWGSLLLAFVTGGTSDVLWPAVSAAETADTALAPATIVDTEPPVLVYHLSGPRLGVTFAPDGSQAISQFGWHFENQAAPGTRGPWFIVENVLLVGGLENNMFIPNETVIFGIRLPSSFEIGVGPSLTIGGPNGINTGIIFAVGQSFRVGGIRVPVNLALAANRGGDSRLTVVTGWAIRDREGR